MFLSPRVFAISRHSHLLCLKPSPSLISMENSTGVSEQQVEFLRATVSFVLGCPPGWEGPSRAKSCLWTHPGPARAGRCPHGGSHPGFLQGPKGAEGTAGETKLTWPGRRGGHRRLGRGRRRRAGRWRRRLPEGHGEEGFSEPQQQRERSARGPEWPAMGGRQGALPSPGVEARGAKTERLWPISWRLETTKSKQRPGIEHLLCARYRVSPGLETADLILFLIATPPRGHSPGPLRRPLPMGKEFMGPPTSRSHSRSSARGAPKPTPGACPSPRAGAPS